MNSPEAPILKITGPPGSGKTRELAREVCRLIVTDGIPAERISVLALTPTGRYRLQKNLRTEARLAGGAAVATISAVQVDNFEDFLIRFLQCENPSEETEVQLLAEPHARILLHRILRTSFPPDIPWPTPAASFLSARCFSA